MSEEQEWITGYTRVPIYYEDTDFSGFVYHANYLKYFERGREELVGLDYVKELYNRGIHYVVARADIKFHFPARHGDILEIETKFKISESPITVAKQCAVKPLPNGKKERLVSAEIKLVAVNNEGEAIRVPQDVLDYFLKLDSNPDQQLK